MAFPLLFVSLVLILCIVSLLSWLENDMWLAIYTASGDDPTSTYNIITRQQGTFTFQRIPDPIAAFGADKPPQHSLLRLRDWPPDLKDLLIVSSTAMPDIGLLSRSTKSLSSGSDSGPTNVFATTEIDDNRRPTLPMTESMDDSTAIGLALDLSSKDKVYKPIPMDEELEESPDPVPGMWVLTHEGILCSWWLIYEDAVKQGKPYPGLVVADASVASQPTASTPAATSTPFGAPARASFGSAATSAPFGSTTPSAPSFGSSTRLGLKSSPWGAPSTSPHNNGAAFGSTSFGNTSSPSAPAFGKPSTPGFGQSSQLGTSSSPWGSGGGSAGAGSGGSAAPAFGQSGFASFANKSSTSSPWGSAPESSAKPTEPGSSGGFAGFSQQGGFASVASNNASGSVFGSGGQASENAFGFSKKEDTAFPPKAEGEKPSTGAFGSQPFKLGSLFQDSATPSNDGPKPAGSASTSLFGSNFGSALDSTKDTAPQQASQEVEMDADAPADQPKPSESKPQPEPQPESQPKAKSPFDTQDKPKSLFQTDDKPKSLFQTEDKPKSLFQTDDKAKSPFQTDNTPKPLFSTGDKPNPFLQAQDKPKSLFPPQDKTESTTPQSTPTSKFMGSSLNSTQTPGTSLFGKPTPSLNSGGGLFGAPSGSGTSLFSQPKESSKLAPEPETPKGRPDEPEAPLPPDTTSRLAYPLGDSSSSSAASTAAAAPIKPPTAPALAQQAPPASAADPLATPKANKDAEPRLSDTPHTSHTPESIPRPTQTGALKFSESSLNEEETESDEDDDISDEDGTEGSGIDVAEDLSPDTNDKSSASGLTMGSSFGFIGPKPTASQAPIQVPKGQDGGRLFGSKPPLFPPSATDKSPRSPSPIRGAVPSRLSRVETRSVSAPGMASQLLSSRNSIGRPAHGESRNAATDREAYIKHLESREAKKQAEETQPLVDTEDDQIQALLASEVTPSLTLDEFVAHTNSAPPGQESVPSQVEAVYRDVNSMIDTLGLNARSVKAFIIGHSQSKISAPKNKHDVDDEESWVLCDIDALGRVLDTEVRDDLEDGRVQELDDKLRVCKDLAKDLHRLRAKREDLAKMLMVKTDPTQIQAMQSMALSAEQAAQQNELRKEFTRFSTLLGETEEALTLLKAKIASASKGSGKTAVPTVEAVMRTITKMTSLVERRSGDVDVLENQIRKLSLGSASREGSPAVTPQARRSIMFSPESTPSRTLRHSFAASIGSVGSPSRQTPPRKRVTTFTEQEKRELKGRRERRQAVLDKLKGSVESKGPVQVWSLEDTE